MASINSVCAIFYFVQCNTFTLSLAGSSTPSRQCAAVTMTAGLQESKTAPHPRQRLSDLRCTICSCSQLKILQKNFDVWHFVSLFDKEQRAFECEGLHFFCKWSYTVQVHIARIANAEVTLWLSVTNPQSWFKFRAFSGLLNCRLEICHDRCDRRSCKLFFSCVNFSRKRVSLQNLCKNIKFTHLFGKITHTFTKKTKQKRTKLIHCEIYAALLLAKIATI